MDTISITSKKINKLYDNLHYFDLYGGSVFLFFVLCVVLFLVISYASVMIQVQPIKDDWVAQRCNPKVMPFAGIINRPDGSTIVDFTQENFSYCIHNILTSITGYAVEPLTIITSALTELYQEIANIINSVRTILSNVRTYISDMAQEVLGRIANIMIPLQKIIIAFVDSIGKIKGVLAAGLYTSLGTYYTLKSLLGAITEVMVILLIALAAAIIILWIIPFTIPAAITGTITFLSFSIPLAIMLAFFSEVLHISPTSPFPDVPSCFDASVKIKMYDGTLKKICDIRAGDLLYNDVIVTATLQLDASGQTMFQLGEVLVSGSHQVLHSGKWIYVKDHPDGKPVEGYDKPLLYCLNTSSKTMEIEGFVFCDWDELTDEDISELKRKTEFLYFSGKDVHRYFDEGFLGDTVISLQNGMSKDIKDIKVGDILYDNVKVYGTVEIDLKGLDYNTTDLKNNMDEVVFHLLTDKSYFHIEGNPLFDYNSCVEIFLDKFGDKY